jgi:hypothetical protein
MVGGSPLVICKPQPAGSASAEEFYLYDGSIASMKPIQPGDLNHYEVIDDAPQPNVYRLPYQHGWLLEFRPLLRKPRRWVVFARDRSIYLDTGSLVRCVTDGQVVVRIRRYGCLVSARLSGTGLPSEAFWIRIPLSRLLFWDPVVPVDQCEPLCDIFSELRTVEGQARWAERWTTGRAFRSTGLSVQSPRPGAASNPE